MNIFYRFSFTLMAVASIAIFLIGAPCAKAVSYTSTANGNWGDATNWSPNGVPDGVGVLVERTSNGNITITQNLSNSGTGVTVGTIQSINLYTNTYNPTNNINLNQDGSGAGFAILRSGSSGRLVLGAGTFTLMDDLAIISDSTSTSVSGAISVSSVLTGTGNITVSNNTSNTYNSGQINFAAAANTFSGTFTVAKGAVVLGATNVLGSSTNRLVLGSTGGGDATLRVLSNPTIDNNFIVAAGSGGVLKVQNAGTGNTMTFAGTTLLNGNLTSESVGSTLTRGIFFTNVISGTGGLIVSGGGYTQLSGTNTFTGATRVSSGTLVFATDFGVTTSLALQKSTLDMNSGDTGGVSFGNATNTVLSDVTLGGLTGSRGIVLNNTNTTVAGVALSVGGNNTSNTYSGTLSGLGSFIKVGTGTQTLTAIQTYTGSTHVAAGTLIINGAVGAGGLVVDAGTKLGGNVTAGGATTVNGTLAVGNSPGTGNFSTLALGSTAVTEIEFNAGALASNAGTDFDTINVSAALDYGGTLDLVFFGDVAEETPFDLFAFAAVTPTGGFNAVSLYAGSTFIGGLTNSSGVWAGSLDLGYGAGSQFFTFTQSTGDFMVSAVPEPKTTVLLGLGLLGGLLIFRRRNVA